MDLESTLAEITPNLLRYCVGASGSPAEGEEIAQEALTALVAEWRKNGPPRSCKAFVYTVAKRVAWRARWRKRLLNAVCESEGCRWDLLDDDPPVLRVTFDESEGADPPLASRLERIHKVDKLNQAITLDLVGAPAPEVLDLIAQVLGTELELDEALADASISIQREDASCRELLDQICQDLDCDWKLIGIDELRPLLLLSKQSKAGERN